MNETINETLNQTLNYTQLYTQQIQQTNTVTNILLFITAIAIILTITIIITIKKTQKEKQNWETQTQTSQNIKEYTQTLKEYQNRKDKKEIYLPEIRIGDLPEDLKKPLLTEQGLFTIFTNEKEKEIKEQYSILTINYLVAQTKAILDTLTEIGKLQKEINKNGKDEITMSILKQTKEKLQKILLQIS